MNPKFAAGIVVLATAMATPSAKALTVTTGYNQFTWTQGTTPTRTPSPLTFATFNSFNIAGATLNSVKYKLSSVQNPSPVNSLDPTGASVGGRIRVNNGTGDSAADVSGATYDLKLQFSTGQLLKSSGTTTSISCAIVSDDCSQNGTGVTIPANTASGTGSTDFVLNGTYSGLSNPLTGTALSIFNTGSTVSTSNGAINNYFVTFAGQTTSTEALFSLNGATISPKAFMTGYIALEYDYSLPPVPGTTVPGPLPLLGAASAFAWSRRMRKRITSAA
jgi:hypothetical protein